MLDSESFDDLEEFVGRWQICQSCSVVDDSPYRSTVGTPCESCGKPSKGGLAYFHLNVQVLVGILIEAARFSKKVRLGGTELEHSLNTRNISVLLFFCTLRELLIDQFIEELFVSKSTPEAIRSRLLNDNRNQSKRINKLIPALINREWKVALRELDAAQGSTYAELDGALNQLVKIRNDFIHGGETGILETASMKSVYA